MKSTFVSHSEIFTTSSHPVQQYCAITVPGHLCALEPIPRISSLDICYIFEWCSAMNWYPDQCEFSHLPPSVPGKDSGSTVTLIRIKYYFNIKVWISCLKHPCPWVINYRLWKIVTWTHLSLQYIFLIFHKSRDHQEVASPKFPEGQGKKKSTFLLFSSLFSNSVII